eukprot:3909760-Pyramimonas_sp.AAC.1
MPPRRPTCPSHPCVHSYSRRWPAASASSQTAPTGAPCETSQQGPQREAEHAPLHDVPHAEAPQAHDRQQLAEQCRPRPRKQPAGPAAPDAQ